MTNRHEQPMTVEAAIQEYEARVRPPHAKLTWTIKVETPDTVFLSDDEFYTFARLCPERRPWLRAFRMGCTAFSIERFGNSAHVYVTDACGQLRRAGLFTWGMSKREAQQYAG